MFQTSWIRWPRACAITSSPGTGGVVGYAGMMYSGDEAHVTNIAVDPTQRTGIGHDSRCTGIERTHAASRPDARSAGHTAAQALYRTSASHRRGSAQVLRERRRCDRDVVSRNPGENFAGGDWRNWRRTMTTRSDAVEVGRTTVVLGIETSCDETAAALVMGGATCCPGSSRLRSNCTQSSAASCRRSPARAPRAAQPGDRPGDR